MSKLQWDKTGERYYETGVDRVVIYALGSAEAWSGVTAINESPSGAEPTKIYADNMVYGVIMSPEEDSITIEAFQYPELFNRAIGRRRLAQGAYILQQDRVPFALCWRSIIGNDLNNDAGYKLHIVPILYASSSEDSSTTINDSPEQKSYSWSATAMPYKVGDSINTSSFVLDSRKFDKSGRWNALLAVEDMLYGTDKTDATMPTPAKILELMASAETLMDSSGNAITDNSGNIINTTVYKF